MITRIISETKKISIFKYLIIPIIFVIKFNFFVYFTVFNFTTVTTTVGYCLFMHDLHAKHKIMVKTTWLNFDFFCFRDSCDILQTLF